MPASAQSSKSKELQYNFSPHFLFYSIPIIFYSLDKNVFHFMHLVIYLLVSERSKRDTLRSVQSRITIIICIYMYVIFAL